MPTTPKDDLFSNYDETFKKNFFSALDDFIADANAAIDEECQEKASKKWQKHLGDRFPLCEKCASEEAKSIGSAEETGSLIIGVQGRPKEEGLRARSKGGVYGAENL
jgi:hypothetical protein